MLFLIISLTLLLPSVFSTQICTAVEYFGVVYETDELWNPTSTVYSYNFNLTVTQNTGNSTFPNILHVTDFSDWSSNSSIYFQSSTFNFIIDTPDGFSNETVVCALSGGNCIVASTNGIAANSFDLNYLTVTDFTNLFVQNGGIYDGFNEGTVNKSVCLMGKSDTISSQHFYKYNQSACCIEYTDFNTTNNTPGGSGTECSTDTSLAWLDIVYVIDVSSVMTKIDNLFASISTYMEEFNVGQNSDHTTRVGIITYGSDVTTVLELKDTTNEDDFEDILFGINANKNDAGGNMGGALNQAFGLVTSQRSYRRPVIVLAAAAYNEAGFKDVNATATSIKEDGIKIVVLNYAENDIVLTNALKGLASDGYYYISSQDDLISSVAYGLTQINCYCSPSTIQVSLYNSQWQNYTNYADCLRAIINPASPTVANKRVCHPGSLVSITTKDKLDFITDTFVSKGNPLFNEKKFSIGFHKSSVDGTWKWWGYNGTEFPYANYPPLVSTPAPNDNYGYMWNVQGYRWILQTGYNVPLKYICQTKACDAENVCKE